MKKIILALLPLVMASSSFAQQKEDEADEPVKTVVPKMSDKIFYISPIKFTENGVGFELGYERGIDAAGIVAYNLPLVATFNLAKDDFANGNKADAMFYFMPGIKFYPTGSHGKVKYALGPSIVIGAGQQTGMQYYYDPVSSFAPYYYSATYVTRDKFVLGVTINNSLNINPTPRFTLGLDFGFGLTYVNKIAGFNDGMSGLVQGGFKMGYRLK